MRIQPGLFGIAILATLLGALYGQQSNRAYNIEGTVINAKTGDPVPRALVVVKDEIPKIKLTDNDGRFEVVGTRTEPAQLVVRKPGFLQLADTGSGLEEAPFTVNSGTGPAMIKLIPASIIQGRILSPEGVALEDVPVTLFQKGASDGEEWLHSRDTSNTNEDGYFQFTDLVPAQYYVLAGPLLRRPLFPVKHSNIPPENYGAALYPGVSDPHAATPINLRSGQDISIDFTLNRVALFTIRGRLTNLQSEGVQSARLIPIPATGPIYDLKFDSATGRFHASQVPPGLYELQISTESMGVRRELNVQADVSDLKLSLAPPKRIAVSLRAKDSGASHGYVLATLIPVDKWPAFNSPASQAGGSDLFFLPQPRTGRYRVHFALSPPMHVVAASCGSTDLLREALVVTEESMPSIEVTLGYDSARLSGQVGSQGQPIHAHILIVPVDPPGDMRLIDSDMDGKFGAAVLPPGTYRVWAFDRLPPHFRNAEALEPYRSKAQAVTLAPNDKANILLELQSYEEPDEDE